MNVGSNKKNFVTVNTFLTEHSVIFPRGNVMIRNFHEATKKTKPHEGIGNIDLYEIWGKPEFHRKVDLSIGC